MAEDGPATLTLKNSTITANSAKWGGGIYSEGVFKVSQTILADNAIHAGGLGINCYLSEVTSMGFNLEGADDCMLTGFGDLTNTPAGLGPLQDNGGPTWTHALLPGSAAIDAGNPAFMMPPVYDQRGTGFPRVVNQRIDIGAYEAWLQVYLPFTR